MKLAIIGSRGYRANRIDIDAEIGDIAEVEMVISGGAKGPDTVGARWARAKGIPVQEFRPDYARYGRGAPLIRNREIIDGCDCVLAFWDGQSRGTEQALRYAKSQGKGIRIVWQDEEDLMV